MAGSRLISRFAGLLLILPLVGLVVWLVAGAVSRSFGPELATPPAAENLAGSTPLYLAGFPPPEADFPSERLYERVNGAADALRDAGCVRILVWTFADPPAELELLVFTSGEGAAGVLTRDAGAGRTAGPGDECSADEQSVFFRRGRHYARLLSQPGAPADASRLLELAVRIDRALQQTGAAVNVSGGAP